MTSLTRYNHWVIFSLKHPRIWVSPTQFRKLSKNLKIRLPGNWTKILITPESAWLIELFSVFWNQKIVDTKKLFRFLISEFSLEIEQLRNWIFKLNINWDSVTIKFKYLKIRAISFNPDWQILENSPRNFLEISFFWGVKQTDFWKNYPVFFRNFNFRGISWTDLLKTQYRGMSWKTRCVS